MSTEENKALARQQFAEWDQKGYTGTGALVSPDFVAHLPGSPGPLNLEGYKQYAAPFDQGFPGLKHTIEDQIAEGDRVVSRIIWYATHTGNFQGIPPTGKQVTMTGIAIIRVANGKIAEFWGEFDALGLLQQLGAIPAPA
jgi:predicted ester cyclase